MFQKILSNYKYKQLEIEYHYLEKIYCLNCYDNNELKGNFCNFFNTDYSVKYFNKKLLYNDLDNFNYKYKISNKLEFNHISTTYLYNDNYLIQKYFKNEWYSGFTLTYLQEIIKEPLNNSKLDILKNLEAISLYRMISNFAQKNTLANTRINSFNKLIPIEKNIKQDFDKYMKLMSIS